MMILHFRQFTTVWTVACRWLCWRVTVQTGVDQKLNVAASVSGSWSCSCCCRVSLGNLNRTIVNVFTNTCDFPVKVWPVQRAVKVFFAVLNASTANWVYFRYRDSQPPQITSLYITTENLHVFYFLTLWTPQSQVVFIYFFNLIPILWLL